MRNEQQFFHEWDAHGVRIMLKVNGKAVALGQWKQYAPASAAVLAHWPHDAGASAIHLTHAQLAALNDYEAMPLNLPRLTDAWMVVGTEGRIDSPHFRVTLTLEQQQYAHPWHVYSRMGALLRVGLRSLRINPQQLALFEALETMWAAGDNVGARLAAWPALAAALHSPRDARIRVQSGLPRVQLERVAALPANGMTRRGGRLAPLQPADCWATCANHRYYLKTA